jgi:trehalose 6-phosphate synthase/phosphatase
MPKFIMVSNRLSVTMAEGKLRPSSGGLVAALEGLPIEGYEQRWIGWAGDLGADAEGRARAMAQLKEEGRCVPVELTPEEVAGHYEGLSNSSLWPLLHALPSYLRFEQRWWDAYVAVNRKFAEAVLAEAADGDLVWVHDYQLMLVPAMLRESGRDLKVGFFLHTPFPPYDVFRYFPRRSELLQGVLGSDLIGFHTVGYQRNFNECVAQLLDLDDSPASAGEADQLCVGGHQVRLGVFPIGILASKFERELASPEFDRRRAASRRAGPERQVVLSVERLDYTKGILHRIRAIDLFLERLAPVERAKVEFVFVSVPSREDIDAYRELREGVESHVGRLNGKYASLASSPIHFVRGHVEFADLVALYATADVALVTPLVDGMNLVAKEYLAARADNQGVLVLSEFAGAAEELVGAIQVNPHDPQAVADAIAAALAMPVAERARVAEPMRHRIMEEDATFWARTFIEALERQPCAPRVVATGAPEGGPAELLQAATESLRSALRLGTGAAMFLDYDGTLREFVADPAAAEPTPELRRFLDRLAATPGLDVALMSGRSPEDLSRFVGNYPFALVAEHGAMARVASRNGAWMPMSKGPQPWREQLLGLFHLYEKLTPGSLVEVKHTGLVWHFRRSNPELGAFRARRLMRELAGPTANLPVIIQRGRKIVEVRDASVSKGLAARNILKVHPCSCVIVAGDDATDESLFDPPLAPQALSVKVGDGPTSARYRVATPSQLRRLLTQALDAATKDSAAPAAALAG